jgi:AraC-like DNA-binding protein
VEKKPYLDSRLNLDRFAELCGLRPRDVSFLLNSHYKKNFHEFINELRIEEVKQLLATQKHKAILEMAMECGFNSHSAFQRFFKRFVGMSPSEYRKLDNNSM